MRILFVCLGNICRSPAAEGIFNNLLKTHRLENRITCDSAGILGYHEGEGAYHKMKSTALKRGYQLLSLSRPVRAEHDFEHFDMIIGMDDQNIADLNKLAPSGKLKSKICKMTDFCSRYDHTTVPDPYYGGTKDYELVIDLLEDACEGLIASIKNN